jgi:uncharacterized integral membrane protein (TIGR00698 family)
MKQLQTEYRGILLSTIIGLISYFSSVLIPGALNSILMALLAGMVVGNVIKIPENFQSGIGFTSSKLLELSILFLAFSINYTHIAQIGVMSFSIIAIMIVLVLLFTYYLSIKVKCPGTTGWLVGFGTAICGSSAIAALSPSITKNKDDVGIAMAVVNLFGSIGMIVMPLVLVKMNLSTTQMGLLLGGTLHSVGNVAGSGYTISNEVGEAAITIKLARVALLSPALIFFNYLVNKDNVKNWKEHFRLPWYLWSFIGITILTSFIHFPDTFIGIMDTAGKIILTIAMAAIGLKVSFKKLYQSGRKGILFGLIVFVVEILIVGGLMMFV